ncbi:TauD/TfdA dioxygenase family protein [Bordetella genomosp. 13]|uniref:TauD/TfdA dioxygenase family protein n=1 Tax=Bordetella genomosp. 13 TaxID=463040 RepID=UPI00119CB2D2|nr:TauD/TfdA family dioxygenase [Bordetella genomosp. 13]
MKGSNTRPAVIPTLTPLTDHLGYEVQGIDISMPLAPRLRELLRGALATRGLLLFRGQELDEAQQIAFGRVFGELARQGPLQGISNDVTYVSNARKDGTFGDVELSFHSDQAYFEFPMKAILLYGVEVPSAGGETLFSSTVVACNAMDEDLIAQLRDRKVRNRFEYGRISLPHHLHQRLADQVQEHWHPVVATHVDSGQRIHMVNVDHSMQLEGVDEGVSQEIIRKVNAVMTRPEVIYRHRWSVGDLIVWDNTLLHHARTPFSSSERRTLRRCVIGHENEVPYTAAA